MSKLFGKSFQLFFIFLLTLSCIVTWSCQKTEDLQLTCTVTYVKADAAVIHSTLSPVKQGVGIQLKVSVNDSVVSTFNRTHNGNTDFDVPGLKPSTNYKVEMSVINDPSIKAQPCTTSFTTTPSNVPMVSTNSISNVTSTGATVAGDVTYEGVGPILDNGVCWNTTANPTVFNSSRVSVGSGLGAFTATIHGLQPATKYHVRANAGNIAGWGYGADSTFTTLP